MILSTTYDVHVFGSICRILVGHASAHCTRVPKHSVIHKVVKAYIESEDIF